MTTVFKSGNSLAVRLPADLARTYGLENGSPVRVEVDEEHGGILISPATPEVASVDAAFARRVSGFIDRYRTALEGLAER